MARTRSYVASLAGGLLLATASLTATAEDLAPLPWIPKTDAVQAPVADVPAPVPAERPSSAQADAAEAARAAKEAAAEAKAAAEAAKRTAATNSPATDGSSPQAPTSAAPEKGAAGSATPAAPSSDKAPADAKAKPSDASDKDKSKEAKKAEAKPAKELFGGAKVAAALPPRSIGFYAKGCLAGGAALPTESTAWQVMRLSRNRNWAHPSLIALLERFATEMHTKENWPGLLIGDLAQPRGGPMVSGHKSHQVGLDADIWFKPMPSHTLTRAERETYEPLLLAEDNGTEVIAKNWDDGFARLVKRAASYPEVERIFVHPAIKKKFCEVADKDRAWLKKVRPMWLHNYHFHVRIGCPSGSPSCEKQAATTGDEGCGKELDDWFKLLTAPKKPEPKPAKPAPPKPEMTLAQLPKECRAVLAAADAKPGAGGTTTAGTPEPAKPGKAKTKSANQN